MKLNYVKGFARPVDYIIRINIDESNKSEYISTLNHELIHIFQFLGTAIGRDLARIDRHSTAWRHKLIELSGPNIELPLVESIEQRSDLLSKPEIRLVVERLQNYEMEQMFFFRPWDNSIFRHFLGRGKQNIGIEYFFKKKPIKLDLEKSRFIFESPDGNTFVGDISASQIMESMAKLWQMQVDGRGEGKALIKECTNMLALQYNFPMLYLLQEGITDNMGWEQLLYSILMYGSQICLSMSPRLWAILPNKEKYRKPTDPGKLFLEILDRGPEIIPILTIWQFVGKMNPIDVCDAITDILNIPKYSTMLKLNIEDVEDDMLVATDVNHLKSRESKMMDKLEETGIKRRADIRLPFADARKKIVKLNLKISKLLLAEPKYTLSPLGMFQDHDLPIPPIQGVDSEVSVNPKYEDTWEFSLLPNFFAEMHLINKTTYDKDLSCYYCWDGSDTVFPCSDFEVCRNRSRNDVIGFCTNNLWLNLVRQWMDIHKIGAKVPTNSCNT